MNINNDNKEGKRNIPKQGKRYRKEIAKKEKTQEKIKLDQIMKLLFRMSKKVMIDLINGLFGENFSSTEVSLEYGNSDFFYRR